MKLPIVLIALLLLAGCATATYTHGRSFDTSKITSIQKGTTTKAEVVLWFGQPFSTAVQSDGSETITYLFITSKAHAQSYILSMDVKSETNHRKLEVMLRNGIVDTYSFSEGAGNGTAGNLTSM